MRRILLYTCFVFTFPLMVLGITINIPDDFETIQAGIEASEDGDIVLVAPGEYVENISFIGRAITVASLIQTTNDPAYIYSTIIDGNHDDCVVSFNTNEDSTSILRGFTIRNGQQNFGGGIDCQPNTSPILIDLYITDNIGNQFGGGIFFAQNSSPHIRRTIIANNSATFGGGIGSGVNPEAFLNDVIIRNNSARSNGGGIYGESGTRFTLVNVAVIDNDANRGGGAFLLSSHGNILQNVTISGNTSEDVGGLLLWARSENVDDGTAAIISNSIIYGNSGVQLLHGRTLHERDYLLIIEYTDLEGGRENIQTENDPELQWGEGNIDEDPLFRNPDAGFYSLTSQSPCIDAGDPESPEDLDESRADMGAFFFDQRFEDQIIELREGWSIMSLAVEPEDLDIRQITQPLIEEDILSILKDQFGRFFIPEFNFSNMPGWHVNNGYQILLSGACDFYVLGLPIENGNEISLRDGWNIIAFHPVGEISAETALESIREFLMIVKDQDGNFWHIEQEFSNLPDFRRGQGYQVKVNQECVLVYPADE